MRVFSNLIKNSVDSITKEGVIELNAIINHENVTLTIKDTGHGINPEIIERIFDPMFSTKATGLGLGLSFVKEVVIAHGGNVTVKSEINKGTEFNLCLPKNQYRVRS